MKNRIIGIVIIIAAVIILAAVISFKAELAKVAMQEVRQNQGNCIINGECIHEATAMPVQTYASIIFATLLLAIGIYYAFFAKDRKEEQAITKGDYRSAMKKLSKEEKAVVELLVNEKGAMFQSDLVEKSGFTKVKVTRILDVLEGRRLVERKRRGMTNVVILKHP